MENYKFTGIINDKTYDNAMDFYKAFIEASKNNTLKNVQYNYNYESQNGDPNQLDMFKSKEEPKVENKFKDFDIEEYLDNVWYKISDIKSKDERNKLIDGAIEHLTEYFETIKSNSYIKQTEIDCLINMLKEYENYNDDLQSQINHLDEMIEENCMMLEIINKILYKYNNLEPKCSCDKKGYDTGGCQCANKEAEKPKSDLFKELDAAFEDFKKAWKDCGLFKDDVL